MPEASFDVVNVGVAVAGEDCPVFLRALGLLRPGGALTVPVCEGPAEEGRCGGSLRKYARGSDGGPELVDRVGNVTFVTPT